MKFKLYISKAKYTAKLNEINTQLGFPSKRYSKFINGVRKHFVADRVMTRTWADENPRETELKQFAFPVNKEMEKEFTALVEYDKDWYPIEEIKIIKK